MKAKDLSEQIDIWTALVIPSSPQAQPQTRHTGHKGHKKQKGSKNREKASQVQSQTQQAEQQPGQTLLGGTVDAWDKLLIAKMVYQVYSETVRTENYVRYAISYTIVAVFFIWAILGLYYLMYQNGNIQVLVTGSAFITGPLGVVIGYFFGRGGDTGRNP